LADGSAPATVKPTRKMVNAVKHTNGKLWTKGKILILHYVIDIGSEV
jgi:hypothetical protein